MIFSGGEGQALGGSCPYEWDEHPYKKDSREFLHPFCQVRTQPSMNQEANSHQALNLLTP